MIKEWRVPIPVLNQGETLPLELEIDPKKDFKNLKIREEYKGPPTYFKVELTDLTSNLTQFASNPNSDFVENRPRELTFDTKYVQFITAKTMLAYYNILDIKNLESLVFSFKYPRFSNFMQVFLVIIVFTFKSSHLLSYVIALIIVIMFFKN